MARATTIVAAVFFLMLLFFCIGQIIFTVNNFSHISTPCRLRFILWTIHLLYLLIFLILCNTYVKIPLYNCYKIALAILTLCLPVVISVIILELIIFAVFTDKSSGQTPIYISTSSSQQLIEGQNQHRRLNQAQLSVINIYIVSFMWCTIGLFLSSIYILAHSCFIKMTKQRKIRLVKDLKKNHMKELSLQADGQQLQGKDCSICQLQYLKEEDFKSRQIPVRIRCTHIFHKECILQWIQRSYQQSNADPVCPNCRQSIKS